MVANYVARYIGGTFATLSVFPGLNMGLGGHHSPMCHGNTIGLVQTFHFKLRKTRQKHGKRSFDFSSFHFDPVLSSHFAVQSINAAMANAVFYGAVISP